MGKITEAEGFISSDKDLIRQEADRLPKTDIKVFGIYHLFSTLLSEEIKPLSEVYKKEVLESLLSFVMMRWAYQSPIKRVANYHAHDYCSEHWNSFPMSDKRISRVLKFIGENREALVSWMKSQLEVGSSEKHKYLMMDSPHVINVSENLGINVK